MTVDNYQVIAQEIVSLCPANFDQAQLSGDLSEDGVVGIRLKCASSGDISKPRVGGMQAFNISKSLAELRKSMAIAGEEPWSRCTFTLFPDGKFKFDVEYDD